MLGGFYLPIYKNLVLLMDEKDFLNMTDFKLVDESFYKTIKEVLENARKRVYRNIQSEMVQTYWQIGKMIVEKQGGSGRAKYGDGLIKELSIQLTKDFGSGFNISNLKRMRQFYIAFQKGDTVWHQLSWSHYRLIISLDDENARNFYIKEAIEGNWSVRQLAREIHTFSYERYMLSSKNHEVVVDTAKRELGYEPLDIIKDPYILDFVGIKPNSSFLESDLEQALIDHLQEFLLELGNGFAFVARQKRFDMDGKNFYIDLVLYNYIVKCFVLIDLKRGELTHQDIGQMLMYVNYFTKELMIKGDNPPIGIILCADKNDMLVKYTIPDNNKQIFASRYRLHLPKEEEIRAEMNKQRRILENSLIDEIKK